MREEEESNRERVGEELEGGEHQLNRVLWVRLLNEQYCEPVCGGECA